MVSCPQNFFCIATSTRRGLCHKDPTGELFDPRYFISQGESRPVQKESQMAWKAPKIVEVPVGMEINMYACAARK